MKQLEQMDIDVPVVKGTEIQSYLIAKANDKLGIIEEAKECLRNKDAKEEAFDNLQSSAYAKLMNWLMTNKKYLTKKAQKDFLNIMQNSYSLKPYHFSEISSFIPEEFDFSNESIKALKEEILNGEEECIE